MSVLQRMSRYGANASARQTGFAVGAITYNRAMAARDKLVPIIVAFPLFLQNLDTSVMATALPSIARSLDVDALQLNLAITAYLLSLAVFLPLSGWFADRFAPGTPSGGRIRVLRTTPDGANRITNSVGAPVAVREPLFR
jgi:hypothetical protein